MHRDQLVRQPGQIQRWLDEHLHLFDLPVQWLGDEPNARGKSFDDAAVRWCLIASWVYEQAAGNSSIPAVYKAVNDARDDFLADRCYLPATPRDLNLLVRHHIPIFGIESKHPIADFDIVGTSISYPVLAMSFVKQLTMSGIPARWRERDHTHPMIIAGGLSYGAPEFLAPVVDCWWLGEVEEEPGNPGIGAVTARIATFKACGAWTADRTGCYVQLAREFNFLYFPRFVDVQYLPEDRSHVGVSTPSKQVVSYSANLEGMRLPFGRRIVKDLDQAAPLVDPPLLYADPAMGSGDLEVGRGCPAWCSFCQLTYRQKPYRQRSVESTLAYAGEFARNMGSVRLAPFSPDFPMHTQRKKLIAALLEHVSDEVDAATMRVDDFIADHDFILLQVHGGMDAVTLGVEGNSQRMRDLVGKGTADEDICEAVARGIRAGIRKFKLYFICNLPGEDAGDVHRAVNLARQLASIREQLNQPSVRIQFSWTPLVIEANTPFQWFAPTIASRALAEVIEQLRELKIECKIGAKAEPNRTAFFQLCQRASRDVGEALVDAMLTVDKACWGGVPRDFAELLNRCLVARGFVNGYADCFDERFRNDMFGWEFIDQGISSELLWLTYLQMREFVEQTDSDSYDGQFTADYHGNEWIERCDTRCHGKTCGACDYTDIKIRTRYLRATDRDLDLSNLRPIDQTSQAMRLRARINREARYRFVDNSHWRFALRRAAFRAQHYLASDHGIAKRSIHFASDQVRHRDWSAGTDYVEFALTARTDAEQIQHFINAMNVELWPRLSICDWIPYPVGAPTLRSGVDLTLFDLPVHADPDAVADRLERWAHTSYIPMRLRIEGGYFAPASEEVNARDHVQAMWLRRVDSTLTLRMMLRARPNPYNILAALMGQASWLDAAKQPATRVDCFIEHNPSQGDFLRPACQDCGLVIPINLLDQPFDPDRCPPCKDQADGIAITRTQGAHQ